MSGSTKLILTASDGFTEDDVAQRAKALARQQSPYHGIIMDVRKFYQQGWSNGKQLHYRSQHGKAECPAIEAAIKDVFKTSDVQCVVDDDNHKLILINITFPPHLC